MIDHVRHATHDALEKRHREHEGYAYDRWDFVPKGEAEGCAVSLYHIPPGQAAYPYHYHHKNEEVFYIVSGKGQLRTPEGERTVKAGDMLFFPANEAGAHKLTNISDSEPLVYLDFDTYHDLDVAVYPDSGKIGVWGKEINQLYRKETAVDYYDGE